MGLAVRRLEAQQAGVVVERPLRLSHGHVDPRPVVEEDDALGPVLGRRLAREAPQPAGEQPERLFVVPGAHLHERERVVEEDDVDDLGLRVGQSLGERDRPLDPRPRRAVIAPLGRVEPGVQDGHGVCAVGT